MKIKIKAALFHKNEDCVKKWLKSITLINSLTKKTKPGNMHLIQLQPIAVSM